MSRRLPWLLAIAPLLVTVEARDALAQAPDDQAGGPPGFVAVGPGAPGGCEAAPAPSPVAGVMARRWAIGAGIGGTTLAPTGSPDDKTQFNVGELALRYRATPHIELELAVTAGQVKTGDDLEMSSATLGLRYRMRPGHDWDWYLSGGVGGLAVTSTTATSDQRNAATLPELELGIGVERRFGNLGFTAELRAIAVAPPKDSVMPQAGSSTGTTGSLDSMATTTPPASTSSTTVGQSGGELILGASYYF